MQIFEYLIVAIIGWFCISFTLGYIHSKYREDDEDETSFSLPDDWTFPIKIEFNEKQWYAWDKDDTFILQADTKTTLIEDILNRFDISPKRLVIISEKSLNENTSKASV